MASSEIQIPQQKYGLSCPSGGSFYICLSSQVRFLGCCETDPCSNEGQCPVSELRPVSYVSYPDHHQSCAAPYDEHEWYTCDFATPKFMGCCLQNPCDQGCPAWNLIPARLADDESLAAQFLSPPYNSSRQIGLIVGLSTMSLFVLLVVFVAILWRGKIKNVLKSFKISRHFNEDQNMNPNADSQTGHVSPILEPDTSSATSVIMVPVMYRDA